jgi:hypothetical protein
MKTFSPLFRILPIRDQDRHLNPDTYSEVYADFVGMSFDEIVQAPTINICIILPAFINGNSLSVAKRLKLARTQLHRAKISGF